MEKTIIKTEGGGVFAEIENPSKIYIATPINARQEKTFREKYLAAKHRVGFLKEVIRSDERFPRDIELISSFDINPLGAHTESQAMGRCVTEVMESDAIYLDHGWQSSNGCNLEYRTAKIYNKKIYEHDNL